VKATKAKMAKAKQMVIPKFSNEAEEAEWWDAHRSEIEADIRLRMKQKEPLTLGNLIRGARITRPVTLRIPTEDLEAARRLAAQQGLGYQTYIKMLLRSALARNESEQTGINPQRPQGYTHVEFDAHKLSKQTVEFGAATGHRLEFAAKKSDGVPVHVRFNSNSGRKTSRNASSKKR
jgi:predicted DNA binding CopG/RHH family protein